jgi:predicted Holliday junction resolvase-like endonuclease
MCLGFILCLSVEFIMILYAVREIIDDIKEKFEKKVREIEDKIDAEEARKAIEESEREGTVSWEEIKKKHNLE